MAARSEGDDGVGDAFPHAVRPVDADTARHLMRFFTGELTGFVRVGREGYFLPHKYAQEAHRIYSLRLRDTDIFVASYPRSGTTWTQELVWLVANDLDYAAAAATPLTRRYPFLEFSVFVHAEMQRRFVAENPGREALVEAVTGAACAQLDAAPRGARRFVKTHLPLSLLPPALLRTARVVYVARDPRDVVVSFYHLNRAMRTQGYVGDFKTYWRFFRDDLHHWTPYFSHLKEAWDKRHHPNMLFLFYEDLIKDLSGTVRRVSNFLGKQYSAEQTARLCAHLDIAAFRRNKSVNYDVMRELGIYVSTEQAFIRKGTAGGWRDYFDAESAAEAQHWLDEHLAHTDMRFPHL